MRDASEISRAVRYSNAAQIIAMTVAWALILIVSDRVFSKHLFAPSPVALAEFTKPQGRMLIEHVGCSGALEGVRQAMEGLRWVGNVQVVGEGHAGTPPSPSSCRRGFILEVADVRQADFIELVRVLRKAGAVPGEIEFGGVPHFALRAEVSGLVGCPECAFAARQAMIPKRDPRLGGTLKWLDSARVSAEERTITAYVRFGYVADVGEMLNTLEQAGFPLTSLRIEIGPRA